MMMLRALLAALLTVALSATGWANCCVGLSFEAALSHRGTAHHHGSSDHHDKGDCGKSTPRACDAMVQASAPQGPAMAPVLSSHAVVPIVVTRTPDPVLFSIRRSDRPPDRGQRFRDIYARTGRLLV
jgi:hypothetical protein